MSGFFIPRMDILPSAQRLVWPELRAAAALGFVLYGGTAIALRLGHRFSVDFDFCNYSVDFFQCFKKKFLTRFWVKF